MGYITFGMICPDYSLQPACRQANLFVPAETKKDFRSYPVARQQKIIFQLLLFSIPMDCVHGDAKLSPFGILCVNTTCSKIKFTYPSPNPSSNPPSPSGEGTRVRLFRSNLPILPQRGNEGEAPYFTSKSTTIFSVSGWLWQVRINPCATSSSSKA